jgi:hypothetical protein
MLLQQEQTEALQLQLLTIKCPMVCQAIGSRLQYSPPQYPLAAAKSGIFTYLLPLLLIEIILE